jgi:2-methylcitrate dehydratase PrpD
VHHDRPPSEHHHAGKLAFQSAPGHDDYNEEVRNAPRIAEVAARIFTHGDESLKPESFPARVTLTTRDGRTFETRVRAQRGGPGNRMTDGDHRRKFTAIATASLGEPGTEQLREAIEGIWEASSLEPVTKPLGGATG